MVVVDVYRYEGKHKYYDHPCIFVWVEDGVPKAGDRLRCNAKNVIWNILEIEMGHLTDHHPLRCGDPIGIILNKDADPQEGDIVELI